MRYYVYIASILLLKQELISDILYMYYRIIDRLLAFVLPPSGVRTINSTSTLLLIVDIISLLLLVVSHILYLTSYVCSIL